MLTITIRGEQVQVSNEEVQQYKEKAFKQAEKYFNLISDATIREFARYMWQSAPDYFFIIPASVSGKYHAEWSTDKGGLVRHVLMGVQVADDLSRTFDLSDEETDLALAAMFGHDLIKYGLDFDERYLDMHPYMPRNYFGYYKSPFYVGEFAKTSQFDLIMTAIERHMGNIMSGAWTSVGGLRPETPLQYVVHLADYVASRKNIVLTDYISGYDY
ncbi:hypothetical protein [Pseudobacillus badius]|uniref:hypothetical protein n=1 Tax=Bacillus badius TaxID=1455 RepID=UPI0007B3212D|nr:hypothetical protein [Bacillus badius]KZR57900.1 hypothetical protein A3781_19175 [Bacillus badius]